jgi:hypothetical protein
VASEESGKDVYDLVLDKLMPWGSYQAPFQAVERRRDMAREAAEAIVEGELFSAMGA